jgi:hypothetical protein
VARHTFFAPLESTEFDFMQMHPISASTFWVAFPWARRFSVALDLKKIV